MHALSFGQCWKKKEEKTNIIRFEPELCEVGRLINITAWQKVCKQRHQWGGGVHTLSQQGIITAPTSLACC